MAREMVNLSDKLETYKQFEDLQDKYDVRTFTWSFFFFLFVFTIWPVKLWIAQIKLKIKKIRFKKLVIQNNALLTMLGEKTEENEELRMDLQDVKEMYKTQVSLNF